jgi:hypothetical protein
MIPKVIHYCWFGEKEMPKGQRIFLTKTRALMPDYEIKIWRNLDLPMNIDYVNKAYLSKKYSNLSNFMRIFLLLRYGGIYLDTDVEVVNKFDELLNLSFFIGHEDSSEDIKDVAINNAVMGASKNHWFLQECLTYLQMSYNGVEESNLSGPVLTTHILSKYINLKKNTFQKAQGLNVFPCEYFHPIVYRNFVVSQRNAPNYISKKTFTIHHFYCSWVEPNELLKNGKFRLALNNIDLGSLRIKNIPLLFKSAILGFLRILKKKYTIKNE